jgi:hypothetical protein
LNEFEQQLGHALMSAELLEDILQERQHRDGGMARGVGIIVLSNPQPFVYVIGLN